MEPVLIGGEWRQSQSVGSFTAVNPTSGEAMDHEYPVSGMEDVEAALAAGHEAVAALRELPYERVADFLDHYAAAIEDNREAVVAAAHAETGLPDEPRLNTVELPRTTDQLRQAAAAVRDRSWVSATIDTATNIRSMYAPLEAPVAVFGPNNFPFAFGSVSGGDFAAAIAAGNPVIAKGHSSHPRTTQLLTEAAAGAVEAAGLPPAMVQLLYRLRHDDGMAFVSHPRLGAVGFTGGRPGGLALKEAADRAGVPIYLEMSSINPVFVLPGALAARGDEIAQEFFASCTLGTGQFCTNPGLVILPAGPEGDEFVATAEELFRTNPPGVLLGPPTHLAESVGRLQNHGAQLLVGGSAVEGPGYRFDNTLLTVSAKQFLAEIDGLQTEAFGPTSLLVRADGVDEMVEIARSVEGNLTGSLYTDPTGSDDDAYAAIAAALRPRVGRLLNDKMPTGVAVVPSMNHGGPFPATGHPGFTAVGIPAAIHRFAALHCYDNVRPERLPPELADANPTGMLRLIDGEWSRADVGA